MLTQMNQQSGHRADSNRCNYRQILGKYLRVLKLLQDAAKKYHDENCNLL